MIAKLSEDLKATIDVVRTENGGSWYWSKPYHKSSRKPNPYRGSGLVQQDQGSEVQILPWGSRHQGRENFIFDLKQYIRATNTATEESKVTFATMHLPENAKLWRRSRYMDIQEGRCTLERLKQELQSQFFLENVQILARRKVWDLKHTGNI